MKKNFILIILTLSLLISVLMTRAQNISSQKGLTTALFTVAQGNIKIYLPDDIRPGDMISGRIIAEPIGKNEKQLAKNLVELKKYSIGFNGEKFPVDNAGKGFQCLINKDRPMTGVMELMNATGTKAGECVIPSQQKNDQKPASLQCSIPTHALCGSPLRITGPFDGNLGTTQCSLDNKPLEVLAESPRQCITSYPPNAGGLQTLTVQENAKPLCSKNISGVEMNLSAGELDLVKGQKTYIDVKITGLQNLPAPAILTLNNITTEVVVMRPSNNIIITLAPDSVKDGTFNRRFDIQSIRSGGFTINVNLDLPDVMMEKAPVNNNNNNKKCNCSITAWPALRYTTNSGHSFGAVIVKSCNGQDCSEKNLAKKWEIVSGENNADITKVNDEKGYVTVKPKNAGSFVLKFSATLTCSDGSSCTAVKFINERGNEVPAVGDGEKPDEPKVLIVPDIPKIPTTDSIPHDGKVCPRTVTANSLPKMDGGLKLGTFGSGTNMVNLPKMLTINRDEYVPLVAEGADFDELIIKCDPINPPCLDTKSEMIVPLSGRVRFEWQILNNKGRFVKLGCLYTNGGDDQKTNGEQVIFMPPYLELPVVNSDTAVSTFFKLSIIDDKEDALKDVQVDRTFEVVTHRNKATPDNYKIEIIYNPKPIPVLPVPISKKPTGSCEARKGAWMNKTDLKKPKIKLPETPDNNSMVLGQWILLEAEDQHENDVLPGLLCFSTGGCTTAPPTTFTNEDNVQWEWKAEGGGDGKFIAGRFGRYVIYQMPTTMAAGTNKMEIVFTVKAFNPDNTQVKDELAEDEIWSDGVKIMVYQPGIRLEYPAKDWLPEKNKTITVTSKLMYLNDEKWQPAFAHMSRIHFFELLDISQEKGVAMNDPIPDKADECFDLQFIKNKKEDSYEAFSPADHTKANYLKCTLTNQFMMARTLKPEKEYKIKILSLDQGSYGFLRCFANINKGIQRIEKMEKERENEQKNGNPDFQFKYRSVDKGIDETKPPIYISVPWLRTEVSHPGYNENSSRVKLTEYNDNRINIPVDIDENHISDNGWKTIGGEVIPDPPKNNDDDDGMPKGNSTNGDGLTAYEEYRGFRVLDGKNAVYLRTDPGLKDIFIFNRDDLDISLYKTVTALEVLQVKAENILSDSKKSDFNVINFNFHAGSPTHLIDQKGLRLIDAGDNAGLLGIACADNSCPLPGTVGPPNWIYEIRIFTKAIARKCTVRGQVYIVYKTKLAQVVAHELCHGNNVCHHGDGNPNIEGDFNKINGLRSGEYNCIMRYDNSGTKILPGGAAEIPGNILCTGPLGTEYNTPGRRPGFESAAQGRGNCVEQIQITGVGGKPVTCKQ